MQAQFAECGRLAGTCTDKLKQSLSSSWRVHIVLLFEGHIFFLYSHSRDIITVASQSLPTPFITNVPLVFCMGGRKDHRLV